MASEAQSLGQEVQLSSELREFCGRLGVLEYLALAVDLIERCFAPVDGLRFTPDVDPETGEEWLNIEFAWRGQVRDFLRRHNQFTRQWVAAVPWPQRDKIHLAYAIL